MLTELCQELRNWFDKDRFFGTFTISGGSIDLSETDVQTGQYFRIIGSTFNDGVYQYPASGLANETFTGSVWLMGVPKAVLDLAAEISSWQEKYGTVESPAMSPYISESFGGYSYSKSAGSGSMGNNQMAASWERTFANRLNRWRKILP